MTFVKVASIHNIKPGHATMVSVQGKEIALFNVGGRIHALDNACPHRGGPLAEGELDGAIVTCPWHGWQFDVTSGKSLSMPVTAACFGVKIEGDDIFVDV